MSDLEPLKPLPPRDLSRPVEPHTFRVLSGPVPDEASDLQSLVDDLLFCRSALEVFTHRMDNGADELRPVPVDLRCLWFSAVVAYARCFNRGSRQKIDPEIFEIFPLDEEWPQTHNMAMTIRDKLIAHRVSELETYASGIYVRPNGEVIATAFSFSQRFMPTRDLAKRLHDLAGVAYAAVVLRMQDVGAQLSQQAESMTPAERLALPAIEHPDAMSDSERTALHLHRRVPYKPRPPVGLGVQGRAYLAAKRAREQSRSP